MTGAGGKRAAIHDLLQLGRDQLIELPRRRRGREAERGGLLNQRPLSRPVPPHNDRSGFPAFYIGVTTSSYRSPSALGANSGANFSPRAATLGRASVG
jgi:hypothetical protein